MLVVLGVIPVQQLNVAWERFQAVVFVFVQRVLLQGVIVIFIVKKTPIMVEYRSQMSGCEPPTRQRSYRL
jgi:hypothetical protein